MLLNPFAKEFQPSLPVCARPIRTRPADEERRSLSSHNASRHPNVGPGQQSFDLPLSLNGCVSRPVELQPAVSSNGASSDTDNVTIDDLSELDEASVLEYHAALQAKPESEEAAEAAQHASSSRHGESGKSSNTVLGSAAVTSPMYESTSSRDTLEETLGRSASTSQSDTAESPLTPAGAEEKAEHHSLSSAPAADDTAQPFSELSERVGPDDFELLRVVGQGAFGKVFQVRMKSTGQIYAMKIMRKEKILEKDHGEYVKSERDALTAVFHPYIVTLRYSFQTATKLYLVLDFINGGHLFFQLYRAGIFDEQLARLYTAEIVLAISHLHSLNFVHRDLKPENVLLDSEGHIKVTDFGLAKGNMDAEGRTNSFIGTMEYMAPEIISGAGHGKAVDWWSTGVLLYEMLCGMPPFRAKSRQQLQKQILSAKLKLPPYLSREAQSLLKGLLCRDAAKRLGSGPTGAAEVQAHAFFRPIHWPRLMQNQVESPFKPTCRSAHSVENFDKIWTDQAPLDSPCASPTRLPSNLQTAFEGFTYVAPSFLAAAAESPTTQQQCAGA